MKIYRGERNSTGTHVTVTDDDGATVTLDPGPSQRIYNHSTTGFEWGYAGSGPAQLALAIIYDFTGSQTDAVLYYQRFKSAVVADWGKSWQLTGDEIQRELATLEHADIESQKRRSARR